MVGGLPLLLGDSFAPKLPTAALRTRLASEVQILSRMRDLPPLPLSPAQSGRSTSVALRLPTAEAMLATSIEMPLKRRGTAFGHLRRGSRRPLLTYPVRAPPLIWLIPTTSVAVATATVAIRMLTLTALTMALTKSRSTWLWMV